LVGAVGLGAVELLTFRSLKSYEEDFHRVMIARIITLAVPAVMFSGPYLGTVGSLIFSLLGSTLVVLLSALYYMIFLFVIALVIVYVYYYYSYCGALSFYIQDLSSKQAERLGSWGVILSVLITISLGPQAIFLFDGGLSGPKTSGELVFQIINVAEMSLLPLLSTWTYRICVSELKKNEKI